MSWPTKILPFRKRDETVARPAVVPETFPRFHKEWDRPALTSASAVAGFSILPHPAK
jgi:hypothetical protein